MLLIYQQCNSFGACLPLLGIAVLLHGIFNVNLNLGLMLSHHVLLPRLMHAPASPSLHIWMDLQNPTPPTCTEVPL